MGAEVLDLASKRGFGSIYGENFENEVLHKLSKLDSLDYIVEKIDEMTRYSINSSKVVYTNTENEKVLNERELILNRIFDALSELESEFDDILQRLSYFCIIKDNLKQLKKTVDKSMNKYYYRTCIIEHDSILHLKSEDLTEEQFEIIKKVLKKLENININKDEFIEIDRMLKNNDLDWVPECDVEEE